MSQKIFKTTVLNESRQSWLIMDVSGYSHFGPVYRKHRTGEVRDVYFTDHTNKAKLNAEIKNTLGDAYYSNLNYVEQV